jgi:hypothetical protein
MSKPYNMEFQMENMNQSAVYTYEELAELKRPELNKRAKLLLINDLKGKNDDLIERIITKTKTVRCSWDTEGNLVAPKETVVQDNGVRRHPVLGEYHKYIVEARESELNDETFANNHYAARIKMGEPVIIPDGFANFIANACYSFEHYYDENKLDPTTGKMGLHTKRRISDFFVRRID